MRYFRQPLSNADSEWRADGTKVEFRCNGSTWDDSICTLDDLLADSALIETDEDGNRLKPADGERAVTSAPTEEEAGQ